MLQLVSTVFCFNLDHKKYKNITKFGILMMEKGKYAKKKDGPCKDGLKLLLFSSGFKNKNYIFET